MMSKLLDQAKNFQVVAKLLSVIAKDGDQVKFLKVAIAAQEYKIKLPKKLRKNIEAILIPSSWLEIRGTQKLNKKTRTLKLKAAEIKLTSAPDASSSIQLISPLPKFEEKKTVKASVLICRKSDCWQRGGKAVCQRLEEMLSDRGLNDQVQIKMTGCLNQCKQAPNVVIMPDKARYNCVKPHQVDRLLDKHFGKCDR